MCQKTLKPRVQAFLEHVQATEEPDVVEGFTKLLDAGDDPNRENLFLLLEKARQSGPGARLRALRAEATRNIGRHPCNS